MRRPPVKEAKKKDDEDLGPEIRDTALSRAITRAKADFPTAGSGIEALAKDFMRSQEQDQKAFDQLRAAERQQADLLGQISKLDQRQDQEINDLEGQNNTLARRLQQLAAVNQALEKKIAAMSGSRKEPAKAAAEPEAVLPGVTGEPAAKAPVDSKDKGKKSKAPKTKQAQPKTQKYQIDISPPKAQPQDTEYKDAGLSPDKFDQMVQQLSGSGTAGTGAMSNMAQQLAPEVPPEDLSLAKQALAKYKAPASIKEPETEPAESRKNQPSKEVDYDDDYQRMVQRVGKLAKAGPMKTVWDPVKRVYKNRPVKNEPGRD